MAGLRLRVFGPFFARRDGYDWSAHLAPLRRELEQIADPAGRERMQEDRLRALLARTYAQSAIMRELWQSHGFHPDQYRDRRDLARVPVFEKSLIAGRQDDLAARDVPAGERIATATGGTTGNSFRFWYDRECYGKRAALTILGNEAYGWRFGDPVACVWNAHQDIPRRVSWRTRLRWWLTDRSDVLDAAHIDEPRLNTWVALMRRRRVGILYGYAHSLALLAEYVLATGAELPRVRLVVTTAEPLFAADRRTLERAFACPVRDRYASREHGLMAQEDSCGRMGYFANSILVETDGEPGEAGDILVTDFWNRAFPFVRYRIGDTCVLARDGVNALGLPAFGQLTGRQTDFLVATDGSRISGMSFHAAYIDEVTGQCGSDSYLALQFVQIAPREVVVRLVPGPGYQPQADGERLTRLVRKLLGEEVDARIEVVDDIPRTASGKYRFTVNATR